MQEEFVEVDVAPRLNSSKTSISDPFGLRRETAFGNSLADSVSFHFLYQWSRDVELQEKIEGLASPPCLIMPITAPRVS
jgi:hypothetical protein